MHLGWPLILPGASYFWSAAFLTSLPGVGRSAIPLSFHLRDQYLLAPDLNHETLYTLMKQMHLFVDFARQNALRQ